MAEALKSRAQAEPLGHPELPSQQSPTDYWRNLYLLSEALMACLEREKLFQRLRLVKAHRTIVALQEERRALLAQNRRLMDRNGQLEAEQRVHTKILGEFTDLIDFE